MNLFHLCNCTIFHLVDRVFIGYQRTFPSVERTAHTSSSRNTHCLGLFYSDTWKNCKICQTLTFFAKLNCYWRDLTQYFQAEVPLFLQQLSPLFCLKALLIDGKIFSLFFNLEKGMLFSNPPHFWWFPNYPSTVGCAGYTIVYSTAQFLNKKERTS